MKILLTGATGFVGIPLIQSLLSRGHTVVALVRDPESARKRLPASVTLHRWDVAQGRPASAFFTGVNAVINLAGEPIAEGRWSSDKKKRILESRTETTRLLVESMNELGTQIPEVFVSASATGFYGSRGDEMLDETSAAGNDFLADVCVAWEKAAHPAKNPRTVILRIAPVLGPNGGMLDKLLPVFKAGAGGPIADGRHWMTWIALPDLIALVEYAVEQEKVSGVLNAVSPFPITNKEFTETLGSVLHRPTVFRVPAFALKLALGEMAEQTVLASQRVAPQRVQDAGFTYRYPRIREALERAVHPSNPDQK